MLTGMTGACNKITGLKNSFLVCLEGGGSVC